MTPWVVALQASLSFTNSQSLLTYSLYFVGHKPVHDFKSVFCDSHLLYEREWLGV